jgi:hypothetical protein
MAMSHATCTHPRTPAGRRACRGGVVSAPAPVVTPAPIRMTGPVARRIARQAVAADNLRAPVTRAPKPTLVIRTPETCVQAELHRGSGMCACGWEA